ERSDLCQPAKVAVRATKLGCEGRLDEVPGDGRPDGPSTEADDVHVVVFDALPRGEVIFHEGGPNAGNLVGANRRADAAAADRDTALDFSASYRASERNDEIGVVVLGRQAVGAEVDYVMSGCTEPKKQVLLQS